MGSSTSGRRRAERLIVLSAGAALVIAALALTIPNLERQQTSALGPSIPTIFDEGTAATGRREVPANRPTDPSTSLVDLAEGSPSGPADAASGVVPDRGSAGGRSQSTTPAFVAAEPRSSTVIRVSWARVAAATGYELERSTEGRRLGLGGDHRRRGDRLYGCRPRSGGDVLLSGARHPGGRGLGAALRRRIGDDAGGSPGGDGPPGDVEIPDHDRSRLERRRERERLPDRAVGRRGDRLGGDRDHRTGRHHVQRRRSRAPHDVLLSGRRHQRGWVRAAVERGLRDDEERGGDRRCDRRRRHR